MMIPDGAGEGPMLQEASRELEAAIHDARVAFDCIALGENDRAHTSAVTARVADRSRGDRPPGRAGPTTARSPDRERGRAGHERGRRDWCCLPIR